MQSQVNEMKHEEERRTRIMRHKLQERKNSLVDRITFEMDVKGSNPQLEALLAQILNASLDDIPAYEQCVDELGISSRPPPPPPIRMVQAAPLPMVMRPITPSVNFSDALGLLMMNEISQPRTRPAPLPRVNEDEKKVCVTFRDLQREAANSTCAICLEKYVEADEVEIRHCAHTFHKKCLTSWETTGRSNGRLCPCCRK